MDASEVMASEVAEVVLPSKGLFYGDKLPDGKVRVRPLTTREEKLLISSRAEVRNRLIHSIVSDCIITEDRKKLAFDDYLVGDVVYLFIYIRSLTYEPDYTFFPTCQYCAKPMKISLRLPHDLGIYRFSDESKEPFPVDLPKSKERWWLRLLRIGDEKAIDAYAKTKRNEENPEFAYRIARHVAKIGDQEITDPASPDVLKRVESLHALDAEAIREEVINNDCGVDLQIERDCPECGRPNGVYFEMTVDFFRSQSAKLRRRRGTIG